MHLLMAQIGGMSLVQLGIIIIVIAAIVAIVMVILRQMGVAVPAFIVTVLWIVLAAIIGIVAIKFIAGLVSS